MEYTAEYTGFDFCKESASWFDVQHNIPVWTLGMTLGTAVYSFRTKIKVQICVRYSKVRMYGGHRVPWSNPSFLWLQIFHCTSFYQDEVKSNSCVLHWTQPHFQALFSVVTDNGMFMQMEFKHTEYTHSWKMIEESQLDDAISFVVLRISYGDCSYLSYYK